MGKQKESWVRISTSLSSATWEIPSPFLALGFLICKWGQGFRRRLNLVASRILSESSMSFLLPLFLTYMWYTENKLYYGGIIFLGLCLEGSILIPCDLPHAWASLNYTLGKSDVRPTHHWKLTQFQLKRTGEMVRSALRCVTLVKQDYIFFFWSLHFDYIPSLYSLIFFENLV